MRFRGFREVHSYPATSLGSFSKTYLAAQFRRLTATRGMKRAVIAVAHTILTIGYRMLQRGTTYQELGANYFDQRHLLRTTKRLVKRLEALGHKVILQSPTIAALNAGTA